MKSTLAILVRATLAASFAAAIVPAACAQLATLDKGHQLLVNNGLQIWGVVTDKTYPLHYGEVTAANMNAVMWSFGQSDPGVLLAGQKWGLWVDSHSNPATVLNVAELAHQNDLVAIQVGDEQQADIENPAGSTKAWLDAAHAGNQFTNSLLYVNSFFIANQANYTNFLNSANPDAISWDSYPFANPHGAIITPRNWLTLGNTFRRNGLGTYIGATSSTPRPYGMYVQTFHDNTNIDPGEAEIRWQQFTAWTMGYSFVDAFIYRGGNNNFGNDTNGTVYTAFQETARQGQNLGPALTKLISYGYGPSFVQGAGSSGLPGEWLAFDRNNAQASQRYLTGVSNVTNLGTKNGGLSGDVYVGFFNPLHLSFGDPTGTTYFMVTNGLGGDLALPNGQSDNTATVAETRQQMTLNFDFGITGINSLQRLNRDTGLVDVINTSFNDGGNTLFTSLGGGKYQLQLKLDGGTGDLFKYNDGTAFVGVESGAPLAYWDNDGNVANNDAATAAGLGGTGSWDSGGPKWYDGTSNAAYVQGSNVVFAGTAGTISFTAPQTVSSLQFKSTGYVVTGSSLTLAGPTIYTDAGVTALINSPISGTHGLIKNGAGTLNLSSLSNYTGGTTINEGVLGISNSSLGAAPGTATPNIQINNGATLRFGASNITLGSTRQIVLGSGGGVFDTSGHDDLIGGDISGSTLTKTGAGALRLFGNNSYSSSVINGGQLMFSLDPNLGAVPASFMAGNITLDGGTLMFAATANVANTRGITINAGGGTIDTQSFSNPSGYNAFQGGFRGPGDLTKIGSGTFFAAATTGGANVSWSGRLIIKEGTWKIVASDGLPYNVPVAAGLKADQVTLDGGTWQIGAAINVTNALRGITVAAGGGTIDTPFNLTWAGPLAGNSPGASLNKTGGGTLTLKSSATAASYSGIVNVNGGTLTLDGGTAMGDLAAINLSTNNVALNFTGSAGETIGSLAGGLSSATTVTLNLTTTAGGNNLSTTFGGRLQGSGTLRKVGTGTMTLINNGNTYSGGTIIDGGTLLLNSIAGSSTGSGTVTVNPGGTLGGTGAAYGAVTVNSGGHIAPGASIESLGVGALTLNSGAILDFELNTVAGVDQGDLLLIGNAGGLSINGGTLNIINAGAMTGGTYKLIDYSGSLNGNVSNITLGAQPAGFTYSLVNNTSNTSIDLVVTFPGDFNGDGSVDGADYVTWRMGLGTTYTQSDYDVWRSRFGSTSAAAASARSAAVPEPTFWMLLSVGASLLLTFSRAGNALLWR